MSDTFRDQLKVGWWIDYNPACMHGGLITHIGDDYVLAQWGAVVHVVPIHFILAMKSSDETTGTPQLRGATP